MVDSPPVASRRGIKWASRTTAAAAVGIVVCTVAPSTAWGASADYSASASGNIVEVRLLKTTGAGALANAVAALLGPSGAAGAPALDLRVAPASAAADSAGLETATGRTQAQAANFDPATVLNNSLASLGSSASQNAPADHPVATTVQKLHLTSAQTGGLVDLSLLTASAQARWAGDDACVSTNGLLADANSGVATASVLPSSVDLALLGSGDGAVSVRSTVALQANGTAGGADRRAVRAVATSQVAAVSLLAGKLVIEVVTPPMAVARATGLDGTASAAFTLPVLTINGNNVVDGMSLSGLSPAVDQLVAALNTALFPATASLLIRLPHADTSVNADGTHASVSGSLFQLAVRAGGVDLATVDVLPLQADASAPAGGVIFGGCNPPVTDPSTTTTTPTTTVDSLPLPTTTTFGDATTTSLVGPPPSDVTSTTTFGDPMPNPSVEGNDLTARNDSSPLAFTGGTSAVFLGAGTGLGLLALAIRRRMKASESL